MMDKPKKKEEGAEQEDLWSSILNDVRSSSAPRQRVAAKNLIVVGDVSSGKNSVVSRLRHKDAASDVDVDEARGCGMEYTYVDVTYEDFDDVYARLGVWILDGDEKYHPLLSYCLNADNLDDAVAAVVLDLSKPWAALASLKKWMQVLQTHVNSLKLDPKHRKDMEEKQMKFFQSYVDPSEAAATSTGSASAGDEEKVWLPLGDNVLVENLGIPLVVIATKSDSFAQLEKEEDYSDEHFDFIQLHLRQVCLRYGASLVYTSSKDSRNSELLHNYLVHISYQLPFAQSATVVDRDAIFVPIGWDSDKKIALLREQMATISADDVYEERIPEPPSKTPAQDQVPIAAEADQIFLLRQQAHLGIPASSGGAAQTRPGETPSARAPAGGITAANNRSPRAERRPVPAAAATPSAAAAAAAGGGGAGGGAGGGGGGGQSGETVLASFFQSLLQKKPGGAAGRAPGAGAPSSAADVRAALDKTQASKKS